MTALARTGILIILVTIVMLPHVVGQQAAAPGPRYTPSGDLVFAETYRTWTFLTSGLGMTYGPAGNSPANPNFDNVFVDTPSYQSFLKTGTWPDKTVMVLEIRGSDSKVSINQGGYVQATVLSVEVHVKDSAKGGWGFYGFGPGVKEARLLPKSATCYSCHEQNGAVDTTFVQFYPTLIDIATRFGTFKSTTH